MATKITCAEIVPGHVPAEVFAAGIEKATLPQADGLHIDPAAERFGEGVEVHIGVTAIGRIWSIEAEVVEFEPAEHVLIHGRSHIGEATIWLDLAPYRRSSTKIDYGVKLQHNWPTRFAEKPVGNHLRQTLPLYAAAYRQNIIDRLSNKPPLPRPTRRAA